MHEAGLLDAMRRDFGDTTACGYYTTTLLLGFRNIREHE